MVAQSSHRLAGIWDASRVRSMSPPMGLFSPKGRSGPATAPMLNTAQTCWFYPVVQAIPALPLSWYWCSRAEGVSLARGARESCAARMAPKPPTMRDCKHKELAWVTATTSETQLSNADNPMPTPCSAASRCGAPVLEQPDHHTRRIKSYPKLSIARA